MLPSPLTRTTKHHLLNKTVPFIRRQITCQNGNLQALRHSAFHCYRFRWATCLVYSVFCRPVTRLFNCSITMSVVSCQWKTAYIRPVPKVSAPLSHSDYRPITITPVLSRLMEKLVVRHFLYPTFSAPPSTLNFCDQFAFRPSGSTTAALIYIFHTVTQLLTNYQYVTVIALDFTKAFDTVRHSTFLRRWRTLLCQTKFITG